MFAYMNPGTYVPWIKAMPILVSLTTKTMVERETSGMRQKCIKYWSTMIRIA